MPPFADSRKTDDGVLPGPPDVLEDARALAKWAKDCSLAYATRTVEKRNERHRQWLDVSNEQDAETRIARNGSVAIVTSHTDCLKRYDASSRFSPSGGCECRLQVRNEDDAEVQVDVVGLRQPR